MWKFALPFSSAHRSGFIPYSIYWNRTFKSSCILSVHQLLPSSALYYCSWRPSNGLNGFNYQLSITNTSAKRGLLHGFSSSVGKLVCTANEPNVRYFWYPKLLASDHDFKHESLFRRSWAFGNLIEQTLWVYHQVQWNFATEKATYFQTHRNCSITHAGKRDNLSSHSQSCIATRLAWFENNCCAVVMCVKKHNYVSQLCAQVTVVSEQSIWVLNNRNFRQLRFRDHKRNSMRYCVSYGAVKTLYSFAVVVVKMFVGYLRKSNDLK